MATFHIVKNIPIFCINMEKCIDRNSRETHMPSFTQFTYSSSFLWKTWDPYFHVAIFYFDRDHKALSVYGYFHIIKLGISHQYYL